ncbi:MAG: hypothetical protein EOM70_01935 [Clostridia bacterium]|nr:hypothetical protein [Clostridia bacterium]
MLRFLRRQIGYRIKKRTFVVLALSVLITAAVAAILSLVAVWMAGPEDVVWVSIDESGRQTDVLGTGINLEQASSDNILKDASFEPVAFRKILTVYDGDEQTLTVVDPSLDPAFYRDGFFAGASARVLSNGDDGLSLKKTATVSAYHSNRVGPFQLVQLPADLPAGREILGFADNGEVSIAVGKSGLVLRGLSQPQPDVVDAGTSADLTDVTVVNQGFLVTSTRGELIYSQDGQEWQSWLTAAKAPLRAVAASEEGLVVAVGDGGSILAGTAQTLATALSPTQTNLIDLAYGNGLFLALAEDGSVLRSSNGTFWRTVDSPATGSPFWRALAFADGVFALGGENGQIAFSEDGLQFNPAKTSPAVATIDLHLLSRTQVIVLGRDNRFHYSSDGGQTWSESDIDPGLDSRRLDVLGTRQIVSADASGQIGIAPLVIEITLSQPMVAGSFAAGDLLFLELSSQEIRTPDSWDVFGAQISERTLLSVPDESGQASMHLVAPATATPDDSVILSQAVNPDALTRHQGSDIYTIELWMRQEQIQDASVRIWLSGDFQPIGTTINHVGSTWKKYAHTFVVPKNVIMNADSVRFNVGFSGPGELWLDKVFWGQPSLNLIGLDASLSEHVGSIQSPVLRLSYLSLGSAQQPSFQWAQSPGNEAPVYQDDEWTYEGSRSLSPALEMARKAGSSPWLVIQPGMGETELLGLMEYLAGPITTPYGHLRMNQGEILPWVESIERIYVEFSDSESQLQTDTMRTGWVDWMIEVIRQSPYYNLLKNKLILIDGMSYSDGVWRSSADYHSSQLVGLYQGTNQNGVQPAVAAYFDQMPRNPAQTSQGWNEIIRVASLHGFEGLQPTLADLVQLQLEELGNSAGLVNLDLNEPWDKDYRPQDAIAARLLALPQDSRLLAADSPDDDVKAYAYSGPYGRKIVLANLATTPKSIRITGSLDAKGLLLSGFDKDGTLLRERKLSSSRETINILPGGVAVLEG